MALPLDYRVPVPSAQVKSAVLLAGLNAPGITRVEEPEATRDHSENMLRHFGATVTVEAAGRGPGDHPAPASRSCAAADVAVPGDPSSAAFPLVAALLVPGSAADDHRGRAQSAAHRPVRDCLREMGADLAVENGAGRGRRAGRRSDRARIGALRAVDVPPGRAPSMIDEYPILAVAAACAGGVTPACAG